MRRSLALLLLGATASFATSDVEFFYTETVDTCAFGGQSIPASNETEHGGVCAWRNDVARLYACPSPDPTCWTWAEQCNDNTVGQVVCNRAGTVFCCNAVAGETCTTTENQINVCISNFTSPNAGVPDEEANAAYASAIGIATVTATKQTVTPTPFETSTFGVVSSSSSSQSSSSDSTSLTSTTSQSSPTASAGLATSIVDSIGSSPTSTNLSADQNIEAKQSISGGAIAGIVIAVLAAMGIVGAAVFFVMRRRSKSSSAPNNASLIGHGTSEPSAYMAVQEQKLPAVYGDYYGYSDNASPRSELTGEPERRTELPTNTSGRPPSQRYEMP